MPNEEETSHRNAEKQLNWVAGTTRPDISFSVCEARTKFKQVTAADTLYVNKIIKNGKNSKKKIKFPQLNLNNINHELL